MDLENNFTDCLDLGGLKTDSVAFDKKCQYPSMLAVMARFNSYSYKALPKVFRCRVEYADDLIDSATVLMKFNGAIVSQDSLTINSTHSHYTLVEVPYGEN
eukprot:612830-Hanusia_phi.AAC.1